MEGITDEIKGVQAGILCRLNNAAKKLAGNSSKMKKVDKHDASSNSSFVNFFRLGSGDTKNKVVIDIVEDKSRKLLFAAITERKREGS